ncbi:MAG: hypothetical protein IJ719_08120 [Clostridia bacterium]|nr:hypothetical protein [Clostridia bacterium]
MTDLRKIVIAGAGAYHFAPAILEDLFIRYRMDAEVWFVEADLDLAELTARAAQALAKGFGVTAQFYYTTQLKKALISADAVVVSADFLDEEDWNRDKEILTEIGLEKQVRLYGGLGGLLQGLRAGNFLGQMAEEMTKICPEATIILCDSGFGGLQIGRMADGLSTFYGLRTFGVSGMTEQTRKWLSLYLNVPEENLKVTCGGLNAFAWISEARNKKTGEDLMPRLKKEITEDSREEIRAQYIDFYDAVAAGSHCMQYEMLADTPKSPKRTVIYSGVGLADFELRKRNLALLTVNGPFAPKGVMAWNQIRTSGLQSARPIEILRALWGESCTVDSLTMRSDGAINVSPGRFVEGPAKIEKGIVSGIPCPLSVEIEEICEQISLCNRFYAEAAVTGNRDALRMGMEADPSLTGVDLLYAEDVVDEMMEGSKDKLPLFF